MALTILGTKLDPFYDNFIRAYKTDYLSLCLARALGANDFGLVFVLFFVYFFLVSLARKETSITGLVEAFQLRRN